MNYQGSTATSSFLSRSIRLGALGIGVAAFWVWTCRRSIFPIWIYRRQRQLAPLYAKEKLIEVLDQLCSEFHQIFSELAQMVISVQRTISSRGLGDALPKEQMEVILMQKGFQVRLQSAESRVLSSNGWSKSALEVTSKHFESDVDVAIRIKGLNEMYDDAVNGRLPLLPGVELPEQLLQQDMILRILQETQQRKIELFDEIFQAASPEELSSKPSVLGSLPSPHLNQQLTAAADKAEKEILERYSSVLVSKRVYHHALAHHSRNDDFKRKKAVMDELHSDQVVDVMKRGLNKKPKTQSPLVVVLHDKLEHVKSEDSKLLIESAEETKRPVIYLVTAKTNDSNGMALLDRYTTELTQLEKSFNTKNLEASFLFTEYDEYLKSELDGVPKFNEDELPICLLFEGSLFKKSTHQLDEAIEFVKQLLTSKATEEAQLAETVKTKGQDTVQMIDTTFETSRNKHESDLVVETSKDLTYIKESVLVHPESESIQFQAESNENDEKVIYQSVPSIAVPSEVDKSIDQALVEKSNIGTGDQRSIKNTYVSVSSTDAVNTTDTVKTNRNNDSTILEIKQHNESSQQLPKVHSRKTSSPVNESVSAPTTGESSPISLGEEQH